MATTPLERLLFLQGDKCFFCRQPLLKAEASIEHLQAVSSGGTNHDDNCVACCKALNRALGNMSLKGKIEVVLNRKGDFVCPDPALAKRVQTAGQPNPPAAKSKATTKVPGVATLVATNLKQRGASRPRSEKTLRSTIEALLKQQKLQGSVGEIISRLSADGTLSINEQGKVTYAF